MKKIFLIFIVVLLLPQILAINKRKIALAGWRNTDYSVECIGTGNEGTQHLKVYFYFKKEKEAGLHAKKSAIDAVLFRGISAGAAGCFNKALVDAIQIEQHNSYFQSFFTPGGEYLTYISASTDQLTNRIKVGDRYKAAMEVSVNLAQLRKKMENDQIIRSLSSGF